MTMPRIARFALPLVLAHVVAVTVARADYYAVSNDVTNHIGRIVRTDDAGNVLQSFGESVLHYPISLAFDAAGALYVGDYDFGYVQKFSANGTYLGRFATVPSFIGSIAFHPDGSLLVSQYDGGPIWRFSADGTRLSDFVTDSGLTRHGQMVFDTSGNFYVCSWTEQTILKYDTDGNPLGVFSDNAKSGITGVVGMAFDDQGQMFVSEYLDQRIKLLDGDGNFVKEVATTFGEIEFLTRQDDGNLLVPYFYDNTIHRFTPDGTDLGAFTNVLGTYQVAHGPATVVPDSVTVHRGRIDAGNAASLARADDQNLRVCRFIVLNQVDPPIQVTVKGTTTNLTPGSMTVTMRSRMANSGFFQQELILIDKNGALSPTERRVDGLGTTAKVVQLTPQVPADFVAADGTVAVRYVVRQTGPSSTFAWCHEADEVSWTIVP